MSFGGLLFIYKLPLLIKEYGLLLKNYYMSTRLKKFLLTLSFEYHKINPAFFF